MTLTEAEIMVLMKNLHNFSLEEQEEIETVADELAKRKQSAACRNDLIEFCKYMQPDYKVVKGTVEWNEE